MRPFITVVLLLMVVSCAGWLRAAQNTPYTIYGPVTDSCGTWTAEIQRSTVNATVLRWWMLGYISGASAALATVADIALAETDTDGIHGWITKYCTEHPLDSLQTAGAMLLVELREGQS